MNRRDREHTMALTYQAICQGERPWVALGNFMNEWFDYAIDRREHLIADPLTLPEEPGVDALHWAAFCAASVEWLCARYEIPCPAWVYRSAYSLPEPWFDSPGAHKPPVRQRLIQQTPEPFARRNVYCGNRMFANKYDFARHYQQHATTMSAAPSTAS
ncbi:MAG: hypothetical protein ACXVCM_22830 [Ktedonobacteraceae bacterium]